MVHPTQTETRLDSPATCRNHCDTEDTCRSLPSPSPLGTTRRNPPDVHRNRRIFTTINETTRFQPNSIIFLASFNVLGEHHRTIEILSQDCKPPNHPQIDSSPRPDLAGRITPCKPDPRQNHTDLRNHQRLKRLPSILYDRRTTCDINIRSRDRVSDEAQIRRSTKSGLTQGQSRR